MTIQEFKQFKTASSNNLLPNTDQFCLGDIVFPELNNTQYNSTEKLTENDILNARDQLLIYMNEHLGMFPILKKSIAKHFNYDEKELNRLFYCCLHDNTSKSNALFDVLHKLVLRKMLVKTKKEFYEIIESIRTEVENTRRKQFNQL